ncbi:MAG: Nitrogen permease regulator 3 [Cirrosporium novae-zelandiae]|nr:MAG: Nitrogen permease regulator 3 [Cirrosporium novae-zelandiae]
MSTPLLPPNPCLIAILFVVQSRSGPRFVFHYPPQAPENDLTSNSHHKKRAHHTTVDDTSTSESNSSDEFDDYDDMLSPPSKPVEINSDTASSARRAQKKAQDPGEDEDEEEEARRNGKREEQMKPAWETVLGFSSDGLGRMLCPSREYQKRRFELMMGPLVFLGWPVFMRPDGTWQKKRKSRKSKSSRRQSAGDRKEDESKISSEDEVVGDVDINEKLGETTETEVSDDNTTKPEDQESNGAPSEASSTDSKKDSMTMFHVVFVLDPPILEYTTRVKEMYHHVVKKFSRGLKWEQARSNYVWKEVRSILAIKEKAKENKTAMNALYANLLARSTLARAVASVYASISTSRIASASLTPTLSLSLQIPLQTSIRTVPLLTQPQFPGLWLTTAEPTLPDDPHSSPHQLPSKSFALLLLDNKNSILRDLSPSPSAATDPFITAMTKYITLTTPTKSFAQISVLSSLPLQTIQHLAAHLIYWRRARAIPPLHQRDIYIVSPNADLGALSQAIPAYSSQFPTLPSLTKMLSSLSGIPRPYGGLIPSKDHKEVYFEILAWLLRGGWVTQLRTFGWVKVSAEIKAEVARDMEEEKREKDRLKSSTGDISITVTESTPLSSPPAIITAADTHSSTFLKPDDHSSRPSTPSTSSTVLPFPPHLSPSNFTTTLLPSPHRANNLESRWISKIGSHFTSEEARNYWPNFVKYFNGSDALEKIAVREGLKRKLVWGLLQEMRKEGGLVIGRHW